MERFILTERSGIYIVNLQQSIENINTACDFVKEIAARGGNVLFVGTKKQAQAAVAEQAQRVGMPYVNQCWLDGMLTSFSTMRARLGHMKELERTDFDDVAGSGRTKRELPMMRREKDKLQRTPGGIRDMSKLPAAMWAVDTKKEHLAISEAQKLGIPVIAILGTNYNPDKVTCSVPGNSDAIHAITLLTRAVADATAEDLLARSDGRARTGEGAEVAPIDAEPLPEQETQLLIGAEAETAEVAAEVTEAVTKAPAAEQA